MLSKNSAEPQASPRREIKAGAAGTPATLNPHDSVDVVPTGNGTVIDPVAPDTKPPGVSDFDLYN